MPEASRLTSASAAVGLAQTVFQMDPVAKGSWLFVARHDPNIHMPSPSGDSVLVDNLVVHDALVVLNEGGPSLGLDHRAVDIRAGEGADGVH